MTDEIKKQRTIVMVTVFAAIFFVLLISALITNLVRIASLKQRQEALTARLIAIDETIKENAADIDYRKTDEYVDAYAREYLGLIGEGESAFIAK
ncbi:MAG: hypothetical protein HFE48_03375 [Clostridia bacterium]|nr:hypothetical protein [Clostridia bacterium]